MGLFLGTPTIENGVVVNHGKYENTCFDLKINEDGEMNLKIVDAIGKVQNNQEQYSAVKVEIVKEFVSIECGFMDFKSYEKIKPSQAIKLQKFASQISQ